MPIRMITPDPIELAEITRLVDYALIETGHAVVLPAMENATHGWVNETDWEEKGPRTKKGDREWIYQTDSTPFLWVDEGTEGPYPIPKQPKPLGQALKFKTGYAPRTTPGAPFSGGPGVALGPWRSAEQVMHPGIEERNFTGMSAETAEDTLPKNMQGSLNRARSF